MRDVVQDTSSWYSWAAFFKSYLWTVFPKTHRLLLLLLMANWRVLFSVTNLVMAKRIILIIVDSQVWFNYHFIIICRLFKGMLTPLCNALWFWEHILTMLWLGINLSLSLTSLGVDTGYWLQCRWGTLKQRGLRGSYKWTFIIFITII